MSQPSRGEVWRVDLGIAGKVRPIVVISAMAEADDFALLATVPHTTSGHPSQYAVAMKVNGLKKALSMCKVLRQCLCQNLFSALPLSRRNRWECSMQQ